jgi:hypothetical protein
MSEQMELWFSCFLHAIDSIVNVTDCEGLPSGTWVLQCFLGLLTWPCICRYITLVSSSNTFKSIFLDGPSPHFLIVVKDFWQPAQWDSTLLVKLHIF